MAKITVEYLEEIHAKYSIGKISFTHMVDLLNEKANEYILVSETLPLCYQSGAWDGLKSDFVIAIDSNEHSYIAVCYNGFMDGSEFTIWYSDNDCELEEIIGWMPLPSKPSK